MPVPFTASDNERGGSNHALSDTVGSGQGTTGLDEEMMHTAGKLCGAESNLCSSNNIQSDSAVQQPSVSSTIQGSSHNSRTSCCMEQLLRMRDELATLHRHLHSIRVKESLLRRLYTNVLLPAIIRGSRQLERRGWLSVRRCKVAARLQLHNYLDYVSGWDMGALNDT